MGVLPDPEVHGVQRDQIQLDNPLLWMTDWRETFDEVRVVERTEFKDASVYAVEVTYREVPPVTVMVDVETGLVVGYRSTYVNPVGMQVEMTTRLSDHRPVGGYLLPHHVELENPLSGRMEITWDEIAVDVDVEDGMFEYEG
jgi:hypothetical protein